MAYIRSKKKRKKNYYYIVEGQRNEEGKVEQKILFYLGNIDNVIKMVKFWKENH